MHEGKSVQNNEMDDLKPGRPVAIKLFFLLAAHLVQQDGTSGEHEQHHDVRRRCAGRPEYQVGPTIEGRQARKESDHKGDEEEVVSNVDEVKGDV